MDLPEFSIRRNTSVDSARTTSGSEGSFWNSSREHRTGNQRPVVSSPPPAPRWVKAQVVEQAVEREDAQVSPGLMK